MKKDSDQINKRRKFIKSAINNPKEAAKLLKRKAKGLENCRNTTDIVEALKDIIYLKDAQIYKDYSIE